VQQQKAIIWGETLYPRWLESFHRTLVTLQSGTVSYKSTRKYNFADKQCDTQTDHTYFICLKLYVKWAALLVSSQVFWNITQCQVVTDYVCFWGHYCLNLLVVHKSKISWTTLMMEAASSYKMSAVTIQQLASHQIIFNHILFKLCYLTMVSV